MGNRRDYLIGIKETTIKCSFFLCCILSTASITMQLHVYEDTAGVLDTIEGILNSFQGWGIENCFITIAFGFLYKEIWKATKFQKKIAVLSMAFSILRLLGECYAVETGGIFLIQKNIINSIVMTTGFACLLYHIITLFWLLRKQYMQAEKIQENAFSRFKIGKIVFLCWLPYFILLYPGTIQWDTGTQLNQFFGYQLLTNASPFLQTFLIGTFVSVGAKIGSASLGVALYILLQMFYMAFVVAYAIETMEKCGVHSKICKNIIILFAVNPIYPLYAISVGKDINFGITVLLLTVIIFKIVHSKGAWLSESKKHVLMLFICLILISLLRNAGIVLAVACFPFIFYALEVNKKIFTAIYAGGALGMLIWFRLVLPWCGIAGGETMANLSIPLQQTARCVFYYGDEMTDEEEKAIDKVLDYNKIADTYNPEIVDPIRMLCRENITKDDMKMYMNVYLRHLIKHPVCYLDAFLNKSYGYFYPSDRGREKSYAFVGLHNVKEFNKRSGLDIHSAFPEIVDIFQEFIESDILREIPFGGMFSSAGFYTWIFIMCIVFAGMAHLPKKYLLVFLPGIFVLIGCAGSPCNAYFRYEFPIVMCVPFTVLMTFIKV